MLNVNSLSVARMLKSSSYKGATVATPENMETIENEAWTHDRLQQECFSWFWNEWCKDRPGDRILLNANLLNSVGGKYGAHNASIGAQAGRADMEFYKAGRLYFFEFKVGDDRQKKTQEAFEKAMMREGACYFIVRSLATFKRLIKKCYENHN